MCEIPTALTFAWKAKLCQKLGADYLLRLQHGLVHQISSHPPLRSWKEGLV